MSTTDGRSPAIGGRPVEAPANARGDAPDQRPEAIDERAALGDQLVDRGARAVRGVRAAAGLLLVAGGGGRIALDILLRLARGLLDLAVDDAATDISVVKACRAAIAFALVLVGIVWLHARSTSTSRATPEPPDARWRAIARAARVGLLGVRSYLE